MTELSKGVYSDATLADLDPNDLLEKLTAAVQIALNQKLPPYIVSEGLDPWGTVAKDTATIGSINLGVCTAKAKASYKITNMKGLSSIVLSDLKTSPATSSGDITGTVTVNANLTTKLSSKVSGSVSAQCGILPKASVGISGTATATGVSGKGTGTFTAHIGTEGACFTALDISSLSLDYKDIEVRIDDLGIFNTVLKPLIDLLDVFFGDTLKGEISKVTKDELNDLVHDMLPICL
jgi:hypothetical protein